MKAFGNPIGNPVRGADGGQGTKVGDIVFAAKAPSANFIPITNQRVYADAYPRLADVLQVRRENDGGEWLRPGLFPAADPSGGQYFTVSAGGVSGGENFLLMYSGNTDPIVARGPATEKKFTSLDRLGTGTAARIDLATSDNGTVIMLRQNRGGDNTTFGEIVRSTDALRTYTRRGFSEAGLGANASRYDGWKPSILSMGGNRWLIINYWGDVYRSDDDGLNWTFVRTLTWSGVDGAGNSYSGRTAYVFSSVAIGGRIWVAAYDFTQNAGNGSQVDALIYSEDLFATFGRVRAFDPNFNRAYPKALGVIGGDLVLVQHKQTNQEANVGSGDLPLRGLYIADGNPANAPAFFEMTGTNPRGNTQADVAVFSWDGIGYMGISNMGLFRIQPRTFTKTLLASTQRFGTAGSWDSGSNFAKFATFALVWSLQALPLQQWSAELLQAVPTDLARRYYQFSDASVVGSQRSDGKLPFMRAR